MKMKMVGTVKNLLLVMVGTVILAFGTAVFIVPFQLVTGGVVGYGIVLARWIDIPFFAVDRIVSILTWGLFLLGVIFLGRAFAAKTLVSTVIYPPLLSAFMRLSAPNVLGGIFDLRSAEYADIALLLAALLGGALIGVGCAVTFLGGGSTGGVDILAFIVCKKLPRQKHTTVIFVLDAISILLGLAVMRDLVLSLLGIVAAVVSAAVIERVFLGGTQALVAQIVSDRSEEISRAVIERLGRTTTILEARGGFSGMGKSIVLVSFSMRQYAILMDAVCELDRDAFITVYKAHAVNGEGWR